MALTTDTGVPGVMEAGNTYNFVESFAEQFPATTFTMVFVYQIPGQTSPFSINATTASNGIDFNITLNAAGAMPGRYSYSEYVTQISSGQSTTAKTGVFQMIPDLRVTEPQTDAQIMLDNITSAIKTLTLRPMISVSVNNVSYTRNDMATLIAMRTRLQAEVIRDRLAADAFRGVETSGRISTRFRGTPAGTPFLSKDIGND